MERPLGAAQRPVGASREDQMWCGRCPAEEKAPVVAVRASVTVAMMRRAGEMRSAVEDDPCPGLSSSRSLAISLYSSGWR